jgi:plasmid stability protein
VARITLFLDDDILAAFRERASQSGRGYQTLINNALRASLSPESAPLTVEMLRKVLHEELHAA